MPLSENFSLRLKPGTTATLCLSETERCYILGHTTYVNMLSWLIKQLTQRASDDNSNTDTSLPPPQLIAKDLSILRPAQNQTVNPNPSIPQPIVRQPLHNPNARIYINRPLKKDKPRLGTSDIHSPTSTTTYIDAFARQGSSSPSSRPSRNTGEGWNSSPSPSDTRASHLQGPSTTSPPPSLQFAQVRTTLAPAGTHRPPPWTPTTRATTAAYLSR